MMGLLLALMLGVAMPDADVPDRPDVTGWDIYRHVELLEPRMDDYSRILLGTVVVYQNPQNKNEFVSVYSRHIALFSERPREDFGIDSGEIGASSLANNAREKYHSQREREALKRVEKMSDPFAYVRWQVVHDGRLDQDILIGDVQYWLLHENGTWAYQIQPYLGAIQRSVVTEPRKIKKDKTHTDYDAKHPVIIGLKFTLGNAAHILSVDQDDILKHKELENQAKSEKKSHAQ